MCARRLSFLSWLGLNMSALDHFEQEHRAQTAAAGGALGSTPSQTLQAQDAGAVRPITTGTMAIDMPNAGNTSKHNGSNSSDRSGENTDLDNAARDKLIEDLDMKRRRLKVQGDIAAEDVAATGELLKEIHGDQSVLVNAAKDAGLFDETRVLAGRLAEETFANDLRALAESMGVPDWLKEEDMAIKLREKSIATKMITRDLMDKVSDRSTEAAMAMGAVDKVSDLLSRNVEVIRGRIREHFDNLQRVLRRRERVLLDAVDEVAKHKIGVLNGQRNEVLQAMKVIEKADEEANTAMDGDDIDYLHAYLSNLNDRLEEAAETFVNSKPYCTADVPCSFGHSTLETIIGGHGTVGNIEELAVGGPTGFGLLQWDKSRTDSRLEISENGHSITHVGAPGKATTMSTTGFANGRKLWRIRPEGTREGEWISLGVCTAGLIGTSAYAQDSVIFSFTPSPTQQSQDDREVGEQTSLVQPNRKVKHKQKEKFDVSPGDLVAVSLDCTTGTVEYYKNSVCVKTALLFVAKPELPGSHEGLSDFPSRASTANTLRTGTAGSSTSIGTVPEAEDDKLETTSPARKLLSRRGRSIAEDDAPQEETVWYPFATLYENNQKVTFVKAA